MSRYYTDETELSEGANAGLWYYMVRMINGSNQPVGELSNVVPVAVTRMMIEA